MKSKKVKEPTQSQRDHDLYLRRIKRWKVWHPRAVWNDHDTREEAIAELGSWVGRTNIGANESVIELGCGNLLVLDALKAVTTIDPARYCGVDELKPFIEYATSRQVRVERQIPRETFDVGVIVGFFASLPDDRAVSLWIKRMRRVTTKRLLLGYTTLNSKGIFVPSLDVIMRLFQDSQSIAIDVSEQHVTALVTL